MDWFEHGTSSIYYEEYGSGDPVLLMPGFAVSIEELAPLTQDLASNYRVVAADLPGSGRSAPQPRVYTPTYYQDDAHAFIALLEHLEIGPAHLMGFSDGGEVGSGALRRDLGATGFFDEAALPLLDAFENVVDNPIEPLRGFADYLKATYGENNARTMTQNFVKASGDHPSRRRYQPLPSGGHCLSRAPHSRGRGLPCHPRGCLATRICYRPRGAFAA